MSKPIENKLSHNSLVVTEGYQVFILQKITTLEEEKSRAFVQKSPGANLILQRRTTKYDKKKRRIGQKKYTKGPLLIYFVSNYFIESATSEGEKSF